MNAMLEHANKLPDNIERIGAMREAAHGAAEIADEPGDRWDGLG